MKILVLSNNPLSESNSNGRTMLNMLNNFSKDEIVNIYINGNAPAFNKAKFYKVKESLLLKFFYKGKIVQEVIKENNISVTNRKSVKTPFKCIIRSTIWKKKKLYKELCDIVKLQNPDCIVVQCGDSNFLNNIAVKLSNVFDKSLFAFNSEDYIFKTWDYIKKRNRRGIFYKLFFKTLTKSYNNLYSSIKSCIYLTPYLEEMYLNKYPNHKSHVIYNSSFLKPITNYNQSGDFVYSGNIGVGRTASLINISKEIHKIFNKKLVIYSLSDDKKLIDALNKCDSIDFRGKLSYEDNIEALRNAKLVIHCENFDDYYIKDTAHSFSTKIADCLSLQIPFLVFAPESSSIYNYILKNDCAFASKSLNEVSAEFSKIKNNTNYILGKLKNASICSSLNHDAFNNSKRFYEIISDIH